MRDAAADAASVATLERPQSLARRSGARELGEERAREDPVLVARDRLPCEAAALLARDVGAAFGERAREMLEADRMALDVQAVLARDRFDERSRRDRDRDAAPHATAARQMIDEQRERFRLRERTSGGVEHGVAIGVAVGRKPELDAARATHRAREVGEALARRIGRASAEARLLRAVSQLDRDAHCAQYAIA